MQAAYFTDTVKGGEILCIGKEIKIWYDGEGDCLGVIFERKAGYFRETRNDAVMEKVERNGRK